MTPKSCPICHANRIVQFFEKSDFPVQDGFIYESREKAQRAPTGRIELHFCSDCGFIWNATFEENKIRYDEGYEISLAGSAVYRDFLHETAKRLATRYVNSASTVIEIGCGDGSFLQTLCSLGGCHGTGYDPTFKTEHTSNDQVTFIPSFFPDSESLNQCDLLCCRHVLQQVLFPSNPAVFLNTIRNRIKDRTNINLYFEVPNASFIFTPENIWNIVYEYHSYFTEGSLSRLFTSAGFSTTEIKSCFKGGQYLGIEVQNAQSQFKPDKREDGSAHYEQLKNFQTFYQETLATWRKELATMLGSYKKIAGWGAGGRAISFFNALNIDKEIQYVVDINVHRQGKFLPVTAQQVVAPEFLVEYKPEAVLITNRAFEQEIRKQILDLGLSPSIFSF